MTPTTTSPIQPPKSLNQQLGELPPILQIALAAILAFSGGGGLGSYLSGRETATAVAEMRRAIEHRIEMLHLSVLDLSRRVERLERERERGETPAPR